MICFWCVQVLIIPHKLPEIFCCSVDLIYHVTSVNDSSYAYLFLPYRDGDIDLEEETAEEIIEQVLQAAKGAKDRLTARVPNSEVK